MMKRIILAFDSFKGCASSQEIADAARQGIVAVFPKCETVVVPVADGGEGTAEAIEAAKAELEAGTLHVFDVSTFTVGGETKTSYMADVDTDADYTPDTEAIVDGYFAESTARSAPYFDLQIDGITLLDTNFG